MLPGPISGRHVRSRSWYIGSPEGLAFIGHHRPDGGPVVTGVGRGRGAHRPSVSLAGAPHGSVTDTVVGPQWVGTFAGYGVDLPVRLAPDGDVAGELPLCALIAGWVRGQATPQARAEVRVYAHEHGVDAALARGRQLRAEIEASR